LPLAGAFALLVLAAHRAVAIALISSLVAAWPVLAVSLPRPTAGPDDTGPGFHDMSEVYTRRLRDAADEAARAAGLRVAHGVYAGVRGPAYETPAEVRALRALGADAVGMSTVQEAIAARALGLEVAAVACIANHAAGVTGAPLDHDDVLGTMQRTDAALADLLTGLIERL
jgi:purine-nucleoside phosphorylase